MQHHIITQLLQERNAHEILQAAQEKLAEETERRLLFYNEITAVKAIFDEDINTKAMGKLF